MTLIFSASQARVHVNQVGQNLATNNYSGKATATAAGTVSVTSAPLTIANAATWLSGSTYVRPAATARNASITLSLYSSSSTLLGTASGLSVTQLMGSWTHPFACTQQAALATFGLPAGTGQSLLVPAYQYPTVGLWPTLEGSTPWFKPSYVIANASNGPGTSVDSNYATAISNVKNAGWTVMGYVDLNYGANTLSTVEANIDLWFSLYGVLNIFFDCGPSSSIYVSYSQSLTNYVRTTHGAGKSILNMGTTPALRYLTPTVCDGIVVFEGLYATYQASPPANYSGYGINIGHIVYNVPAANATSVMQTAVALGANWVYVTDEADNNYTALPSYWASEDAAGSTTTVGPPYVPGTRLLGSVNKNCRTM